MDLRIRNPYINKFLHGFSNQNELKVIKYLAILGIHSLEADKKKEISFSELKNRAKNITKNCAKEDKVINKELHIIKNELVKLSKKFEQSLQEDTHKDPGATLSHLSINNKAVDQKNMTKKPPSSVKGDKNSTSQELERKGQQKTARASSIEPKYDWQITQRKASNQIDGVTMKPTEIAFASGDYKKKKHIVTRHHLDDTEAKRLMTDEELVRKQEHRRKEARRSASHNRIAEEHSEQPNAKFRSVTRQNDSDDEHDNEPDIRGRKGLENGHHSPAQNYLSNAKQEDMDDTKRSNQARSKRNQGRTKKGAKHPNKEENKTSTKVRQKILREKAKNVGRSNLTHASHTERLPTEYSYVESKIKNEVNYHKELSKQYRKMRQSIQEYTEPDEKFSDVSSSRHNNTQTNNKFVFVNKSQNPRSQKQPSSHRDYPSQTSLETPSSSQNSQYRKYSPNRASEKSLGYSKYSASRGMGGMLDIANSFLNSPFMRHLSNIDGKNPESSSSSSINPSASVSVRGNTYGRYDALEETPVNLGKPPREDHERFKDIPRTYLEYADWKNSGKMRNEGKENSNFMNESTNNKYTDFNGKESGAYYGNRNEGGSFASSHFSNFLNDEMKGFFQKETLDLERPKHPKSMVKSSANSSRISFNANELSTNFKGANNTAKRNETKGQDRHNNKSCLEELAETPNVFREDRMSMSHLLNTS